MLFEYTIGSVKTKIAVAVTVKTTLFPYTYYAHHVDLRRKGLDRI